MQKHKCEAGRISSMFMLVLAALLSGCAGMSGDVTGKVYENSDPEAVADRNQSGMPARDAWVVVTWWVFGQSRDTCFHGPLLLKTDAAGVFQTPGPAFGQDNTNFLVYKPGYAVAEGRFRTYTIITSGGNFQDKTEGRLPVAEQHPVAILRPLTGGARARLDELAIYTEYHNYHQNFNCIDDSRDRTLVPQVATVLLAMVQEAQALAKTEEDKRRAERMRYQIEVRRGNTSYPNPDQPPGWQYLQPAPRGDASQRFKSSHSP